MYSIVTYLRAYELMLTRQQGDRNAMIVFSTRTITIDTRDGVWAAQPRKGMLHFNER